ncbi:pyrimidine-specific ribonucleoside hydrolase RihA-like [Salvelinus namaycush]|uniref:Pyrimidine-specific ribonucleoside hydrolase RihA-like n=1 Tax=Salvelinus namaycush TaxID=8040 RepID=A0A8U0QB18_SALNM|nr:pyrimidine-specific ribonucleoside hydrolase RihA-like [Salvelinus namaycush]
MSSDGPASTTGLQASVSLFSLLADSLKHCGAGLLRSWCNSGSVAILYRSPCNVVSPSDNPKQVSLVALGPLTNLALAIRLDPSFQQNLKELIIMGGNMEGKGNVSLCGEFNFVMDPESAFIVLEEYLCPTRIASWEYCCRNKLEWEFFEKLINEDTPAGRLMKAITSKCWGYSKEAM